MYNQILLSQSIANYDILFTSLSLSDHPLSFFHSFPKILYLTSLLSRREPGGHQFTTRPQSFPTDQKDVCSIPLMGMLKSCYWQYWILSVFREWHTYTHTHTHKKFCIYTYTFRKGENVVHLSFLTERSIVLWFYSHSMVRGCSSNFKKRLFELQLLCLNHRRMCPFFSSHFLMLLWKREKYTPFSGPSFLILSFPSSSTNHACFASEWAYFQSWRISQ